MKLDLYADAMFRPTDAIKRVLSGMSLINLSTALMALAIALGLSQYGCGPVAPSISKFASKAGGPGGSSTTKLSDLEHLGDTGALTSAEEKTTTDKSEANENEKIQITHFVDLKEKEGIDQKRKQLKTTYFELRAGRVQEFSQRADVKFTSNDLDNSKVFKGREVKFLSASTTKNAKNYRTHITVFLGDAGDVLGQLQKKAQLELNFSGDEWQLKVATPTINNSNELAAIDAEKTIEALKNHVKAISIEFIQD